jgi:hypothetical protein
MNFGKFSDAANNEKKRRKSRNCRIELQFNARLIATERRGKSTAIGDP